MATPSNTDVLVIGSGTRLMELTVDPTAGAGVSASFGVVALRNTGSDTQVWRKSGAGDTAWTQLGSGGGGGAGYQLLSEKDVADGYAGLDGSGLVDPSVLPVNVAVSDTAQTFTGAQTVAKSSVAFSASLTIDAALSNSFDIGDLTEDLTFNVPTGLVEGGTYIFYFQQDSTGGWAVTFDGAAWKWGEDGSPTMPTDPGAVMVVSAIYMRSNLRSGFKKYPAG